ncbi:ATPase with chaperone activity [Orrella marina]|uniref:ATPase with chaperone activity n=1 Tax=Orrella marina TaxID=2163011 RepID=A0A2R4XLY2_9BURK|nr:ATPase with chaperone activity [Orrella marina]AWB34810.1 ATPase with chaperone activity [Orrella marina]
MSDERQILIPQAFLRLYQHPVSGKPIAPRAWLEERHELCEDFSQLLAQQVQAKVLDLGITRDDALERVARGLDADPAPLSLSAQEISWVKSRVAEILYHG